MHLKLRLPNTETGSEPDVRDAIQIDPNSSLQEQNNENNWSNHATPSTSTYTASEIPVSAEIDTRHYPQLAHSESLLLHEEVEGESERIQ